MADETPVQVFYIENTQSYNVVDITEVTIPFYVEITDQAHDSDLIEIEDLPIPAVACYIENSKVFNITMDSSGRDGKDGLPGKDGTSVTFESLTPEQLALLQQPATDAAADLYETITQLQQQINNWFFLDQDGNVGTNYNLYSTKGVSAYGVGVDGGGGTGGGLIQNVYGYDDLDGTYDNSILTNTFNAYTINQINARLIAVEAGGGAKDGILTLNTGTGLSGSATFSANQSTNVTFTVSPNFGTTLGTIAQGNDDRIIHGQIAYDWGDHAGLYEPKNANIQSHISSNNNPHNVTKEQLNLGNVLNVASYSKSESDTLLLLKLDAITFNDLFEKVNIGTLETPKYAIKAKYDFYSIGEVSAFGAGTGSSSGGGLIQTVYGNSSLGGTFNNATLTDTFNAYTINQINNRLTVVESSNPNINWGTLTSGYRALTINGITHSLAETSHTHAGVYELALSNPSTSGYLLSSTTAGVRSWVAPYSLPIASASVLGGVKIGTNVTISNGVISVHDPLNIGTANGLSLSNQKLSLALATTSSNGALSSTDKTYIELLKTFFEWDATNNAIKAKYDFYSTGEVSAYGAGSGTGGSGLIQTVYGLSGLGGTYSNATLTDTFNAYAINSLHDRINSLEAGSALSFATTGSGNVVTSVTKSGTSVSVVKGLTAVLEGDSRLTNSRPNPYALTFSGYSTATYDGSAAVSVALPTKVSQLTNDSGYLTSIDADLVAIAALTGTSGLLRKTAADTWALDTNAYLTTITKAQVEAVLTGNITTHTHSQYLTGNQTITVSGDATGSGTTSIALTLANSGVVAGTYNNLVTQISPFTVDSKGRITGIGTAVTIQPAWGSVTGKPTTISGYGITDAYTKTQIDSFLALKLDVATFNDLFEKVNIGTTASPVYAIKAKYNFYSVGEVSAFGAGTGSGGSGLIQAVYGYSGLGGTYNNAILTDTFNAYTINKINADLGARITSLEAGSTLTFTTIGSGNAVTSVTKSGTNVTVTKGLTFSVDGHTHTFASLTSKPTTLAGYGITDALLASAYTATDVLTKLKTVDGHSSGLDADTIDLLHASDILVTVNKPSNPIQGQEWVDLTTGVKYTWLIDTAAPTEGWWVELGSPALSTSASLEFLTDVTLTNILNDNILKYNGSKWVNISPLDLPISTATNTALGLKANQSYVDQKLDLKANLNSPTFTGTVYGLNKSMVGLSNVDNTADSTKNVASAAKWTTTRSITIGSTSKNVNGSANVSWSLNEIGAQPLDSDLTAIATLTGTTGLLKKTATNTWILDTTQYTRKHTLSFTTNSSGVYTISSNPWGTDILIRLKRITGIVVTVVGITISSSSIVFASLDPSTQYDCLIIY